MKRDTENLLVTGIYRDWTWENIHQEIPRGKGYRVDFINGDSTEDTGENWLLWRNGEIEYFEDAKMLTDAIFMNTPN